ncbi:hypothetical protein, partial [Clostridium novyi]|uniref:hypothetical protein n=1 Tax=Clostridium novyi TaxID=1542 RepID=UPI00057E4FD3
FDVFNKEYNNIYILTHSYILSQMIDIKIKHNNVYNRIINLSYNAVDEEINNMLNFNEIEYIRLDSDEYKNNILKEIIKPIMIMYLKLVKLSCNGKDNVRILERDEEKFTVLYKNDKGEIFYDYGTLEMWLVISDKNFEFINKMEFLDSFNIL